MVYRARLLHLLGSHVEEGAHDLLCAGQRQVGRRQPHQLGQAEVGDRHAPLTVQEDVLRLDVAVDQALVVRVLQGIADLRCDLQRLGSRQRPAPQEVAQVPAIHVLHRKVVKTACVTKIVD